MVEYWDKIAPYYDIGEEEEETKKQRMIEINFLERELKLWAVLSWLVLE